MTDSTEEIKRGRGRPIGTTKEKTETTVAKKKHVYINKDNVDYIKEKMLEAIEICDGIVAKAAEKINIRRQTHYQWLNNDPDYKQKVDDLVRYAFLDYANKQLYELMQEKNTASIIYAHKYATGYQEANNTFVNIAMPPNLRIVEDKD